jgi:hypothetical protein
MAEFSYYCWSGDNQSVHWLVDKIDLHPLLGADEISGDIMIFGQYHTSMLSLNMCVTVAVVQTASWFWFLFFLCSDFRCSFWLGLHFFLFAHILLDVKSL